MLQKVRLVLADTVYAAALRDSLAHTCAWHIDSAESLDPGQPCVLVLDDGALARLPLSLANPECIVLITHKNSERMAQAWDAGIVSVVGWDDPMDTVLLAIMAAALRCPTFHSPSATRAISPNSQSGSASITPIPHRSGHKRCKTQ
jgi:hypothetical protein